MELLGLQLKSVPLQMISPRKSHIKLVCTVSDDGSYIINYSLESAFEDIKSKLIEQQVQMDEQNRCITALKTELRKCKLAMSEQLAQRCDPVQYVPLKLS